MSLIQLTLSIEKKAISTPEKKAERDSIKTDIKIMYVKLTIINLYLC